MAVLNKTNTLVIVPAYNEQDSIASVIEEIKATGFPFVVIDDGSTDETRIRAIAAGARTISLPFNSGVGAALKCGFKYSLRNGYSAMIQCDADGQHPANNFYKLIENANQYQFDYVVVSRYSEIARIKWNYKTVVHQFLARLISTKNLKLTDTTSGLRLIRSPLLETLSIHMPQHFLGDTFETLFAVQRAKYRIGEIAGDMRIRSNGRPSQNFLRSLAWTMRSVAILLLGIQIKIPCKTTPMSSALTTQN
jgi:glycosyltransferase involved in cell wall biosynthesis